MTDLQHGMTRARIGGVLKAAGQVSLLFVVVAALQWTSGAYRAEFSSHPDEAAHYAGALMVHQYVKEGFPEPPFRYAENFYLHYPKLGIGHWPPMLYVLQAGWTLLFSPSRVSVLLFHALLNALVAWTLYRVTAREFGHAAGLAASLAYCVMPVVQILARAVMAESLLTLAGFAAVVFLSRFLESERASDVFLFAAFTAGAIMTKGSGWLLGPVFVLAVAAAGKWRLFRSGAAWAAGVLALLICAPWQILTMGMVLHGWESPEASWAITVTAAALSGRHLVAILGIPLLLLAAAGAAVTVSGWRRSKRKDGVGVAAVALVVGVFVFHVVVPTGPEPRKLVMAAPAVLYLAAAGAAWLAGFSRRPWVAAGAPAALLAAAALAIPGVFGIAPKRSFGYREAIDYVESRPALARSVMLVSSDAVGEGIAVTEVALRANHPSRFVLRATKALADSDWTARDYRLRFRTPETMMQRLDEIPVGLLLIDTEPYSAAAHHDLLRQVVARFRDRWELLCTFSGDGRSRGRQVLLYRLIGHETRPIGKIEVDLRRMLGRSITN